MLLAYVLAGQASNSALLSLSVGMKAIVSAANAVIGFGALFVMLRTLRWRSALEPDSVAPRDHEYEHAVIEEPTRTPYRA